MTQRPDLPASVDADEFDTVIVDTAAQADPAAIAALRQSLQASGVGSLWLDRGSNETTGIALLSHHTGSPVVREGANDRDATATGYVITAEHPIFAAGQLSNSALTPEMFVSQNSQSTGPKFTAWFRLQRAGRAGARLGGEAEQRWVGHGSRRWDRCV